MLKKKRSLKKNIFQKEFVGKELKAKRKVDIDKIIMKIL